MIEKLITWYRGILAAGGLSDKMLVFIENATIIIVTLGIAMLADIIVKRIIIKGITKITQKTKNNWDDILVKRNVFNRLAHLAPAIIIFYSLQYIFNAPELVTFLGKPALSGGGNGKPAARRGETYGNGGRRRRAW